MNRSLLFLVPALALFLMACPQKHTTSSATPPVPDPNGYNNQQVQQVHVGTVDEPMPAGGYSNTANTSNTPNSNNGTVTVGSTATGNSAESIDNGNVTTPDSLSVVGSKPDSVRTRLVVSFISTGGGIDLASQANLDKWLSKHPDVKYAQNQWGREGEVDYCFFISEKRTMAEEKSIIEIKELIGSNPKVLIKENKVCTHKHEIGVIAMPNVEEAPDAPKVDSTNIARVVVSFISQGQGVDYKAKEKLQNWLKEQNVEYEEKNWGREGETNICIALKGKTTRQQDIFVRDLRTFLGTNELVIVEEWGKCDKRK